MSADRVVVAMSGGVDSSVAAAMLKEQGWQVIGISLLLAAGGAGGTSRRCCSVEDFRDARRVADKLQIPYYVLNFQEEFRGLVTERFARDYLRGRTPNPCILCNKELKFKLLRRRARALGASWIASGHYARIERDRCVPGHRLLRGRDPDKDQSYFLFSMTQSDLRWTLFPLGDLSKREVRGVARRFGLPVAAKRESQEICFVSDNKYAAFVEKTTPPGTVRPGPIVDQEGRNVGEHPGIHHFTVGQRRGLRVSAQKPLYVTAIDAEHNLVRVGPVESLRSQGLVAEEVSWVGKPFSGDVEVKTRYRQPPMAARVQCDGKARAVVQFHERFPAVAPGQAAVFYRGDEVLGGGIIVRSL